MTARPIRRAIALRALVLVAVLLSFALGRAGAASADTLYALTGQSETLSTLYTVNPTTGALTEVGPLEIGGTQQIGVTGLAIDPDDGQLYGFLNSPGFTPGFQDGTLLAIDKTTGDAEPVGALGDANIRASDLAFDAFGNLYAWTGGCAGDLNCNFNGSDLYTLDTATGTSTKVGESGIEGFATGIAFDSSEDTMYLKSFEALFRVNPLTGHVFSPQGLSSQNTGAALTADASGVLYTTPRRLST